jgi:hypothetical protein
MGRTNWPAIIIGGGALVGVVYAWANWKTVCPQLFGEGSTTCNSETPLDAAAQAFNQLPTIADNPTTSNYRSTRINTNPNASKNAAIQLERQRVAGQQAANTVKQTVARKNALPESQERDEYCAGAFCKSYPSQCPKCKGGKWVGYTDFHSFNTITLNKLSVR